LFCDAQFIDENETPWILWFIVGGLALLCSTLAYELTLPLFLLNPYIARLRFYPRRILPVGRLDHRCLWLFLRNVILVGVIIVFKLAADRRHDEDMSHGIMPIVRTIITGAYSLHRSESDFGFNFWQFLDKDFLQYGVALPYTALKALAHYAHLEDLLFAVAAGAGASLIMLSTKRADAQLSRTRWLTFIIGGFMLALAGYGIFLVKRNVQFTLAGVGNRVSMMALPGVAVSLVGLIGLGCTAFPERMRRTFLALGIGVLCACGTLVNSVIASFFVAASGRQEEILTRISDLLPSGSRGDTFLIKGFCPYVGPGVVFEAYWDVTGAMRMRFNDKEMSGNVVGSSLRIDVDGVHVAIYGEDTTYRYAATLKGMDLGNGAVAELGDERAAAEFLESEPYKCPVSEPGVGVRIF
jgi:hypothetical protein